jgi:Uma2 family endonuclease
MSLVDSMDYSPIVLPSRLITSLEDFCAWTEADNFPKQGRISYIDGEVIIDMSPERAETHNRIKTRITTVLDQLTQHLNTGMILSDGMQISNVAANLATEPDGMFVTWEGLKSGRVKGDKPTFRESVNLLGSPDWVMEVVSPSSIRKDKKLLRKSYFEAGIPEYWLIDALGDEIEFEILIRGQIEYIAAQTQEQWKYSPVYERWFNLSRKENAAGLWEYTLAVRE